MEWVFPYPSSPIDDGGSISSATASSTNYTQLDSISSYGDSKGSEPSCTYPPFPTSTPVQQNGAGAGAGSLPALLTACAEAVQENDLTLAESLVKRIGFRAVFQTGTMRKLAFVFAEALSRRIYKLSPQNPIDHHLLSKHFYEACPFHKFAHFTCNQAILEAFKGKDRVHVIDFSINRGLQWQPLLQALALRPGGPPAFRLSGIGPPSHDNSDYHHEIGRKLARLAETIHIEFEYRGVIAESLADLTASMLDLRPGGGESVAVNSVFELHKLLARPGAIDYVLSLVKQIEPEVVTIAEQEANHNEPVFLDRFTESLHYYSNVFVSMEGSTPTDTRVDDKTIVEFLSNNSISGLDWSVGVEANVCCFKDTPNKGMAQEYLEKQICNIVACEGVERVERHETLSQWRTRFDSAGFVPLFLEANASRQASILFAKGDEYRVEQNNGCLMLGWRTRPLVTTSFWRPANT